MNNKISISLNIDDAAPIVHVWYEHFDENPEHMTSYGEKIKERIPNSFMEHFCGLVEKYDLRGKFSVVPLPGGKNPYDTPEGREWLKLLHEHLEGRFSFCPEMLTHHKAYDIENDCFLDLNEEQWAELQDTESMTKYIEYALRTLKSRGVTATGVTSPWHFGRKHEEIYREAISKAFYNVFGMKQAWYFLNPSETGFPELVLDKNGRRLYALSRTETDYMWDTLESGRTDGKYISETADKYITSDGKDGSLIRRLDAGGHPVIITHWQSLFSNGSETGLSILAEVAGRISEHLSDRVEFVSYDEKLRRFLQCK